MNTINLGSNTLGVQTASERYFGKDVSDLTLSECAVLAAVTANPTAYNPIRHPEANQTRQRLVLSRMRELELITEAEYTAAREDPVYERITNNGTSPESLVGSAVFSWFEDAAISQAASDLERYLGWTDAWDACRVTPQASR